MKQTTKNNRKPQGGLHGAGVAALLVFATFGCMQQLHKISERNPDLFEKESDRFMGHGQPPPSTAPELFVRKQAIAIKKVERPNETGSLFNPDDERNYLFTSTGPFNIGRFLTIKLMSNRDDGAGGKIGKTGGKGGGTGAGAASGSGSEGDALEQELLKALPELTPANKGDPSLVKAFKMKIVHRYDNGDVLAMTERTSGFGDQVHDTMVQARIPYDRLAAGDQLTTDDLLDVKFNESRDGEIADRASSGWEDEYSLRLSGFDEAKSRDALELEDKKHQLADAKDKLQTQIKTFGAERASVAKQRADLLKKQQDQEEKQKSDEEKLKEQQGKIEEQTKTIDEQTNQIKDLEEKPGDKNNK